MNYFKKIILIFFYFFLFEAYAQNSNIDLINKISKNIRCLICQGQSVYDSQSDFAISIKVVIQKKLDEGYSENAIYDYLKKKYGQWIVYEPDFNKNTFLLWLLPILIFVIGGILILKKSKIIKL